MSGVAQVNSLRKAVGAVLLTVLLLAGMTPGTPAHAAPALPPPVISSFAPTVARAGDAVTVTATNIDPEPAVVAVLVNGVAGTVTSRTATTVTFTVPYDAGGGKITVTTPGGSGVSSGDLFIMPSGSVDDVSTTGRIVVGAKTTIAMPVGKTALRLFDGDAGDRFAVQTEAVTPDGCSYDIRLHGPRMIRLGNSLCTPTANWLDPSLTVEVAGTRTLSIRNASTTAGSVTVTVTKVVDANFGVLALDGTAKTVTFAGPGQNGYFTFTGTVGQRLAVQTTAASSEFGCCYLTWAVYGPDGKRIGVVKSGNAQLDPPVTLPLAGTYQLRLDPQGVRTGSITVTARSVLAQTDFGALALDGTARTATLSTPNQDGYFTFAGTAAQRVAVRTSAGSFGCCYLTWGIYAPDGKRVGVAKTGNAYLEAVTLPTTGTYRVRLDPTGIRTGSITVSAWDVAAHADLGVLPLDGTAKIANLSSAGRNAFYTFSGAAGQRAMFQASKAATTFGCCYLNWGVFGPTGARVGAAKTNNSQMEPVTLPLTGTYQLRLDPVGSRTGTVQINAWSVPADVDLGVLALTSTAKTVSIANPGQNGFLTFTGTAGQSVTFTSTKASAAYLCCFLTWSIRRPDGVAIPKASKQGNSKLTVTLPVNGTYQLRLDPAGTRTGSVTFTAKG